MGITGAIKSITHSYTWNEYLFYHIQRQELDKIEWVLQNKPELIDQPLTVNYKTTPLHRAAVLGNTDICKLLVEKYKANVNVMTENGESALMGAAKRDHLETVRYLLTMGADTDHASGCGLLPIEYAILGGFYETALVVYEKMKNKELKDFLDYEALGRAFHYRYVNYYVFVQNLKKQVDPDNVANFLIKERKVYSDPVIDPRQSWKQWFWRQMDFQDPPICERSELPEASQPQNRLAGKMHHYMSRFSMTSRVQRPHLHPKRAMTQVDSNSQIPHKQELMSQQVQLQMKSIG